MNEEKILINKLETNYKTAGSGPAVLILHGWGGSSDSWLKVQENLSKNGYKVIVPDLPGFGKSKPPLEVWSVSDYAKWVLIFCGALNLDKFFLVSHSFGGRIAIKFTVTYPGKIKSLILCDSAGIKPRLDLKGMIIFQFARIGNAIFSPKPLARFKDMVRSFFYVFLRNKDYSRAKGIMREIIKKVLEEDLLPELTKIDISTLIIWGEKDKLVPLKNAYVIKEMIKGSKLEILPKIGHSPHLEVPEKLSEIILNFLKQ